MRTTRFNMKDFGIRLRKLRQACGKTQEELCDEIGISDTHYRKIEAGSRTGSLERAAGADGEILQSCLYGICIHETSTSR